MKFTAHINNESTRATDWQKVFGTNEVQVQSLLPQSANILGEIRQVYMLDLKSLSDKQYERLLNHIAEKFNVPVRTLEIELPEVGVPLLCEDLIVTCDTPFLV